MGGIDYEPGIIERWLREAVEQARAQGWSVNGIANKSGVPQPILAYWLHEDEEKRKKLPLRDADRLADWLGMRLTKAKIPRREET